LGKLDWGSKLPLFFMRAITQTEAVSHIKGLLKERGHAMGPRLMGSTRWVVFEHQGRQLGVDPTAGVWVRASEQYGWRCLASPCTVSGAIQAVEYLITG
jgi:hypothetical protein